MNLNERLFTFFFIEKDIKCIKNIFIYIIKNPVSILILYRLIVNDLIYNIKW